MMVEKGIHAFEDYNRRTSKVSVRIWLIDFIYQPESHGNSRGDPLATDIIISVANLVNKKTGYFAGFFMPKNKIIALSKTASEL